MTPGHVLAAAAALAGAAGLLVAGLANDRRCAAAGMTIALLATALLILAAEPP